MASIKNEFKSIDMKKDKKKKKEEKRLTKKPVSQTNEVQVISRKLYMLIKKNIHLHTKGLSTEHLFTVHPNRLRGKTILLICITYDLGAQCVGEYFPR